MCLSNANGTIANAILSPCTTVTCVTRSRDWHFGPVGRCSGSRISVRPSVKHWNRHRARSSQELETEPSHAGESVNQSGHMSYRPGIVPYFDLTWDCAPSQEVCRFGARRWMGRQEHRPEPALLSISRHRPSAQGAPLQSLILSADMYDATTSTDQVNHLFPPILDRAADRFPPTGGYSSGYERSPSESGLVGGNDGPDRIVPGSGPPR
jgi:hypothetical protein